MARKQPHRAVADRFRFFLSAAGLTKEQFVLGLDGAVSAPSLFAVLSGSRRPSRAVAVLIERTWGFRAEFLLRGRGEMWTTVVAVASPSSAPARGQLSAQEDEVVEFMRSSIENQRTMQRQLEHARYWSLCFRRVVQHLRDLDALGASGSAADAAVYAPFVKVVLDDYQLMLETHERLIALLDRRRAHRLLDRFVQYYLIRLPRDFLTPGQFARLEPALEQIAKQRRESLRALEDAIARDGATVANLSGMPPLSGLMETRASAVDARLEGGRRPRRGTRAAPPEPAPEPGEHVAEQMRRLMRDLVELWRAPRGPNAGVALTPEAIEARYRSILDPVSASVDERGSP